MKLGTFVRPNDLSRLDEAFAPLREMGFTSCQLAYKPEVFRPEDADLIRRAAERHGVEISAHFIGFRDAFSEWDLRYGFLCQGLTPPTYRQARLEYLLSGIPFVRRLGTDDLIVHAGFVPNNPFDPEYLGLLAALLNVGIIRMADAMRKEAYAREKQLAQEKANCELASVNSTLRESICRAEMLREQMQREQEEKKRLYRSISRGIRTPLNVVVGLAGLLTRTDDIETMKRYAGQMNGQIERVMAVLSDEKKPVDLGAYASAQPRSTERRLTGLRVLLAEDSEMNAEIMIRLLTDAGAECDRAADGMQALRRFEAVEAGTYDVVLMDMQMPVMDGCEAARAIRRCGRAGAADIPIIAMTANAFEDVRERIFDAGMDGYLGKPVEPDKLACAVIAAVKTRKGD